MDTLWVRLSLSDHSRVGTLQGHSQLISKYDWSLSPAVFTHRLRANAKSLQELKRAVIENIFVFGVLLCSVIG